MATQILDFSTENGLVLCNREETAINNSEKLYLSEIQSLDAHSVFFRRYYQQDIQDSKPYRSDPAVCIFLEESITIESPEHYRIHAALWSEGKVDIYIIYGLKRVEIYNAKKPAERDLEGNLTLKNLRLASEVIEKLDQHLFSARLFGTGTFWEQNEFASKISEMDNPHVRLLDYLMEVRKRFSDNPDIQLSPSAIDKLLILSILVKFLEEKKDKETHRHTLDEIYSKYDVDSFTEAVQQGKLLSVVDELANEFNGKIFDQFTDAEKLQIEQTDLSLLYRFLTANINLKSGQAFLWEQYSFKHLPAEVISAIYENFIQAEAIRSNAGQREKGVVYTPIHLVNFLVDEAMPLHKPELFTSGSFKVLDPTCGSGVFLVAAYKRLLQWWAINNSTEGNIQYPDKNTAQQILEDNIFGVDVKGKAVLVTIFSLTTALLDYLTPKEIWGNLKFKDLKEQNIQQGESPTGFFSWALKAKKEKRIFDLVIGNPPFNPETGVKKNEVLDPNLLSQIGGDQKIPGGNFALPFFETSMVLAKKVCMIIPSNVLLYNKSAQTHNYRKHLFTDYTVEHIYDFTHLRRNLFHKSADTPVLAIIAENEKSKQQPISHTVVKRMLSSEKQIRFEIDHYDHHSVKWDWAIDPEKKFVWKTNLLGGGRLFQLIYRLNLLPKFKDYVESKKWDYSVGYKLYGGKPKENIGYIYNKETIITSTFNEDEDFETFIESNSNFAEPRNKRIYEPPHIILKVNIKGDHIPIHYSERYLCFKDKLIGLHAPFEDRKDLKQVYDRFTNPDFAKISKVWILSTSAETMVNLETTCKKEDIDTLPYLPEDKALQLSMSERIIADDLLSYNVNLGKSINSFSGGAPLFNEVSDKQLLVYGQTVCKELNSLYATDENCWQLGDIKKANSLILFEIGFGIRGELGYSMRNDKLLNILYDIKRNSLNKTTVFNRIYRYYEHRDGFDRIYLIKPNALKYWLRSIALRDADETFADFRKEGY